MVLLPAAGVFLDFVWKSIRGERLSRDTGQIILDFYLIIEIECYG